jgi:hypothetical protein
MNKENILKVKKFNYQDKLDCYQVTVKENESEILYTVPIDDANVDYQTVLQWEADGNTIEEAE